MSGASCEPDRSVPDEGGALAGQEAVWHRQELVVYGFCVGARTPPIPPPPPPRAPGPPTEACAPKRLAGFSLVTGEHACPSVGH